jgi:hypothetical protein
MNLLFQFIFVYIYIVSYFHNQLSDPPDLSAPFDFLISISILETPGCNFVEKKEAQIVLQQVSSRRYFVYSKLPAQSHALGQPLDTHTY